MRHLSRLKTHLAALTIALLAGSYLVLAQAPAGGQGRGPAGPPPPMSFFITSASKGDGANYGGVAGADAYCQQLATAAGRGAPVTWHAYLSTQGTGAVNARDRIGNGPWYNANGALVGTFNRKFTLLDRYVLDLTGDPGRMLDRRIALALGVMLDTGERR